MNFIRLHLFAVQDTDISSGTVALYAKHATRFDNVVINSLSSAPGIILASPKANSATSESSLSAEAIAINTQSGDYVEFLLDWAHAVTDSTAPFTASFNGVAAGSHTVTARLMSSANVERAIDYNLMVGTGGMEIIAIGDSITNGIGDSFRSDNFTANQRFIGFQGWQAMLIDSFQSTLPNTPVVVYNEGQGGDQASDAANTRIASIKERYPGMDRALLGFGTNDTLSSVPSGLGCSNSGCDGTFTGNMRILIDKIRFADYPTNSVPTGVNVSVALTPPVFGDTDPYNSVSNVLIREYNDVIAGLSGVSVGPDLFAYFMPSPNQSTHKRYLFDDPLHPNGLGYQVIGVLWHNSLNPSLPLAEPWYPTQVTSSLASNLPQVDFIEFDDVIRVDGTATITSLPGVIASGGRWLLTNNDFSNTSANYLSFVVDRNVTVYIAYDGGATARPNWMSTYTDTGINMSTSDPNAPTMRLYSRTFTSGSTVTLGGNNATGAANSNSNYVAIVMENSP